jgi:hypothetical protein
MSPTILDRMNFVECFKGDLIMKRITQRSIALSITLMLALASVAMSAPKSERSKKRITIDGRVLQVNKETRTLLVSDIWSKKLYSVRVPEGESFRITFGIYMKTSEPEFWQVRKNDRVRLRCVRDASKDHLARLDDGRDVVAVTVSN